MGPRAPQALLDAHVSSRTTPGTAWPCGKEPPGILPDLLCPAGYAPLPSPMPSPLTAVHHPPHEVPGVGAAVPQ